MSFPNFTSKTTANEVAAAFANQIRGKTVLVTGTSLKGIGFTAVRALAKDAGLVIITGRTSEKLKQTQDAIKAEYPHANIRPLVLDLASQASVRKAAAEVNAYSEPLHILIHNAAVTIGPFVLTEDKLESQFASDHVSPFLFTKLVAPKILASTSSGFVPRVIFVSSLAHGFGTIDWDTLARPDENKYNAVGAYGQAKIANILTAKELTKRSGGRIQSFSLHPGTINTSIEDNPETLKTLQSLGIFTPEGKPNTGKVQFKTREEGGATTVAAAIDPRIEGKGGAYLCDSVIADDQVSAFAADLANAEKLWAATEDILGEKFTFN
ncbi:NAD-P-binding protein [Mycena amicta]|nr:NAD-P-binding protein [Mycena amicta]